MNKAQESLTANIDAILANLPEEFHADAKKQAADAPAADAPLTGDAEVAAIKAELVANPDVNESEAAAELTDVKAPAPVAVPTEAEIKVEMDANLAADHTKEA